MKTVFVGELKVQHVAVAGGGELGYDIFVTAMSKKLLCHVKKNYHYGSIKS